MFRRDCGWWSGLAVVCWSLGCLGLAGCGGRGGDAGPPRYTLSGSVTFEGKPVPTGYISFVPDAAKGNTGPGAGATISNGKFATEAGKGTIGGVHRVKIVGFDGVPYTEEGEEIKDGRSLFRPWEFNADLPMQNANVDYEVPADQKP